MKKKKQKHPRDMTIKELCALPTGPMIRIEEPVTAEDRKKGMWGVTKMRYERPQVKVNTFSENDPIFFYDKNNCGWTIGQWADGRWFKQIFM